MRKNPLNLCETHEIGPTTRERLITSTSFPILRSYQIASLGFSHAHTGFRWVRHNPSFSVILLSLSGQGHVWTGDSWQLCPPNMAYLTPPSVLHAYHCDSDHPWELCWITFEHSPEHKPLITSRSPLLLPLDPSPLQTTINGLYRECISSTESIILHHWCSLIRLYTHRLINTQSSLSDQQLWQLWERVDTDLAHPWTLTTLAQHAYMSEEHLRLRCHQLYHRSPMQQVTFLHMQRAGYLLRTTHWPIETIAQAVGYSNATAFTTAFKRWMHTPPSTFRHTTTHNS